MLTILMTYATNEEYFADLEKEAQNFLIGITSKFYVNKKIKGIKIETETHAYIFDCKDEEQTKRYLWSCIAMIILKLHGMDSEFNTIIQSLSTDLGTSFTIIQKAANSNNVLNEITPIINSLRRAETNILSISTQINAVIKKCIQEYQQSTNIIDIHAFTKMEKAIRCIKISGMMLIGVGLVLVFRFKLFMEGIKWCALGTVLFCGTEYLLKPYAVSKYVEAVRFLYKANLAKEDNKKIIDALEIVKENREKQNLKS